jgi:hypothetical protein
MNGVLAAHCNLQNPAPPPLKFADKIPLDFEDLSE